jgi:uncharacterized protein YecE (DUF72 family)
MEYACSRFPTVEINGTFYSLQRKAYFEAWHRATADDFVFAVKGSRFITHMKQLNDPGQALANFFGQGILALGAKLGPILWQFSQRFRFREVRLHPFLELLPADHDAAARLARDHDHRARDPAVEARADGPIRHVIEVRHQSFLVPEFVDLLRQHDVALVVSDNPGLYPVIEEPTTDLMYLRLHGSQGMYAGNYRDPALDHWADRIRAWARGGEPDDAARVTDSPPARRPRARRPRLLRQRPEGQGALRRAPAHGTSRSRRRLARARVQRGDVRLTVARPASSSRYHALPRPGPAGQAFCANSS